MGADVSGGRRPGDLDLQCGVASSPFRPAERQNWHVSAPFGITIFHLNAAQVFPPPVAVDTDCRDSDCWNSVYLIRGALNLTGCYASIYPRQSIAPRCGAQFDDVHSRCIKGNIQGIAGRPVLLDCVVEWEFALSAFNLSSLISRRGLHRYSALQSCFS